MEMKIEHITLEDGRAAERRSFMSPEGEKVIEIWAQEKQPLKLEKRITEKSKEVLAHRIVETINGGDVAREVYATDEDAHKIHPVTQTIQSHSAGFDRNEMKAVIREVFHDVMQEQEGPELPMQTLSSEQIIEQRNNESESKFQWTKYAPYIIAVQIALLAIMFVTR